MSYSPIPALVLSIANLAGGLIGYLKAGSFASLAGGTTVGILYLAAANRIANKQTWGVELAIVSSIVLAGISYPKALRTTKPVPILLSVLATYGLANYGLVLYRVIQATKSSKTA